MSSQIVEEWNRHQSGFARRWRVSMVARKKVSFTDVSSDSAVRDRIARTVSNDSDRDAMLKDIHLIEAALATDCAVISLDEEVRALFAGATRNVGELKNIVWANPDKVEDGCLSWLEDGAKPDKNRVLGSGKQSAEDKDK